MKKNFLTFSAIFMLLLPEFALASTEGLIDIKIGSEGDWTSSLKVFMIIAFLSMAPSFFIMFTVFPYVTIVLGLTRQALGTMSIPPNQVIMGLAIFVTVYIMSPVFSEINEVAYKPYAEGEVTLEEAIKLGEKPLKDFMVANTYDGDIKVFLKLRNKELPNTPDDLSIWTVVPAFQLTQISKGLFVGLLIYASFAFIDMIVGSVLMFMGMIMLPPQMLSLPVKLLVFVFIGGFTQIVEIIFRSVVF